MPQAASVSYVLVLFSVEASLSVSKNSKDFTWNSTLVLWEKKKKKNCFCHFSGNRLRLSAALLGNLGYYLITKCQFCNETLAAGMQQIDLLDIYINPIMYMRSMHLHCVRSVINRHLQFLWTVLIAIKYHRALCTVRQKYSTYTPCNWSFLILVGFFFHKWEKKVM